MHRFKNLFIFLITLFLCGFLSAEEIQVKVIGVTDGDTVKVLYGGSQVKVRLSGIDAPEKNQSFGQKSKTALSNKVFGKNITIDSSGKDRYGRLLGTLYVGQRNINFEMVREGFAWMYRRYTSDQKLAKAEDLAKSNNSGLWSEKSPIPPWEFRRGARSTKSNPQPAITTPFVASKRSKVYHKSGCVHANKISPHNLITFDSKDEALSTGRRLCKRCK